MACAYIDKSRYEEAFQCLIHHSPKAKEAFRTVAQRIVKNEVGDRLWRKGGWDGGWEDGLAVIWQDCARKRPVP